MQANAYYDAGIISRALQTSLHEQGKGFQGERENSAPSVSVYVDQD